MNLKIKQHKSNRVTQPITITDRTLNHLGLPTMSNLMRKHSYKRFELK